MNNVSAATLGVVAGFGLAAFGITQSAQAIEPALTTVGAPGNAADFNGRGSVAYIFQIGRFEVTVAEYAAYLNAVDPNATNVQFFESPVGVQLNQQAPPGTRWSPRAGWANKPITGVSWVSAARFVNWLELGQPFGPGAREAITIGTYDLSTQSPTTTRRQGAQWALPNPSEWYKAAYYDPWSTGADADVTHWPPAWAVSDRPAPLWAVSGDLAFPLARTNTPGRWLAVTCLRA